jgi:hypothetical protein
VAGVPGDADGLAGGVGQAIEGRNHIFRASGAL